MITRRYLLQQSWLIAASALTPPPRDFDVHAFGAVGDGVRLDTGAIQRAVDAAGAHGGSARVLLRGGKRYRTGGLRLPSGVEFHLADDATLLASTDPGDYAEQLAGVLNADGAVGLKITGTGHIDGQALKFMNGYSDADQRWEPKAFRPRMFSLVGCKDLEVSGISFGHSPNWGLHLLGCERVLVDGVRIRNYMDVPNCDGIDPDHCRGVEIRNCDIVSADDAIVIKTSEQKKDYGPTRDIVVKDCTLTSRDSGMKIGTETFDDISKVRFERCKVLSGGRGPTITHRQKGNISDIEFNEIEVVAEHHAARWWGWGEGVSVTVWPRVDGAKVGTLSNIRLRNLKIRSENSFRIDGTAENPIRDVLIENVAVEIDRWTSYPGGRFDNRPTSASVPGLEEHGTPAFFLRQVDGVRMVNCKAAWGSAREPYWTHALEEVAVCGMVLTGFDGKSAFPARDEAVRVAEGRLACLDDDERHR